MDLKAYYYYTISTYYEAEDSSQILLVSRVVCTSSFIVMSLDVTFHIRIISLHTRESYHPIIVSYIQRTIKVKIIRMSESPDSECTLNTFISRVLINHACVSDYNVVI